MSNILINILVSIDSGIISSKKEGILLKSSDSGEKILTNLNKNITDLLDFEFYKIRKNNFNLEDEDRD